MSESLKPSKVFSPLFSLSKLLRSHHYDSEWMAAIVGIFELRIDYVTVKLQPETFRANREASLRLEA